jgi:hypothetical protein
MTHQKLKTLDEFVIGKKTIRGHQTLGFYKVLKVVFRYFNGFGVETKLLFRPARCSRSTSGTPHSQYACNYSASHL